jgi:hypothetical protein
MQTKAEVHSCLIGIRNRSPDVWDFRELCTPCPARRLWSALININCWCKSVLLESLPASRLEFPWRWMWCVVWCNLCRQFLFPLHKGTRVTRMQYLLLGLDCTPYFLTNLKSFISKPRRAFRVGTLAFYYSTAHSYPYVPRRPCSR